MDRMGRLGSGPLRPILTCLSRDPPPTPLLFRAVKLGTARRSNSHRGNRRHPARGTDELSPDGVDDAAVIYGRDTLKIHGFLIWWRRPAGRTLFITRAEWSGEAGREENLLGARRVRIRPRGASRLTQLQNLQNLQWCLFSICSVHYSGPLI